MLTAAADSSGATAPVRELLRQPNIGAERRRYKARDGESWRGLLATPPRFLRCTRVRRGSLRCFSSDMRLRRFLITEPMTPPSIRLSGPDTLPGRSHGTPNRQRPGIARSVRRTPARDAAGAAARSKYEVSTCRGRPWHAPGIMTARPEPRAVRHCAPAGTTVILDTRIRAATSARGERLCLGLRPASKTGIPRRWPVRRRHRNPIVSGTQSQRLPPPLAHTRLQEENSRTSGIYWYN